MANYWLSYTVKDEVRPIGSYDDRRDHIESVTGVSKGSTTTWDETTSFILFADDLPITAVGKLIASGLDGGVDRFVIAQVGTNEARYWGAIEYPYTLKSFYPSITKL